MGVGTPGMMKPMPNKPRTPITGFRIPTELKQAVTAKAASEGKTLTDIVIEALTRYVKRRPS